jgi:uncharacterized protein (DUF433 family)
MHHYSHYIAVNPTIRFGKPCIEGTRIAIEDILQWLASGMSVADIIADFPALDDAKVRAALAFASHRERITRVIAA